MRLRPWYGSPWSQVAYLAAMELVDSGRADAGDFYASETVEILARLGRSLAIAGALCAAYAAGDEPGVRWHQVGRGSAPEHWRPGCQWPLPPR